MNYIAYLRVSTDKQGQSGLGLEAQQNAISAFLKDQACQTFIEVESGGDNDRPELAKALDHCRKTGDTMVVAKLDRLSRDEFFLLTIINSGVQVKFLDMPDIDTDTPVGRFMLNSMINVSAFEKRLISQRTKAALAAAKARGTKLGNPNAAQASAAGNAVKSAKASQYAQYVAGIIAEIKAKTGVTSLREIAEILSARGIKTARKGTTWYASQVANVLARAAA